jgi:hypothetical protein
MTDTRQPAERDVALDPRPAFTLIHVLWLSTAGGLAAMTYAVARDMSMVARVAATLSVLIVAMAVLHVLVGFIVMAVVIPRLEPGSYWSREVGSYMATVFPTGFEPRP